VRLTLDRWLLTCFGRYVVGVVGPMEHARRLYACRELMRGVAEEFLRRGVDVILDDGFFLRGDREHHVAWARRLGARAIVHFVDAPRDVLRQRLAARNSDPGQHCFEITADALETCIAIFEPPSPDEGADRVVLATSGEGPG
jgi:predicted kinase